MELFCLCQSDNLGRRRVAVARHRMICLVLAKVTVHHFISILHLLYLQVMHPIAVKRLGILTDLVSGDGKCGSIAVSIIDRLTQVRHTIP